MKGLTASAAVLALLATLSGCSAGPAQQLAAPTGTASATVMRSGEAGAPWTPESIPETPSSLARLPAAGYVDLGPADEDALRSLGLGGSLPLRDPPSFPFNHGGLYWSEPFLLDEGDVLSVTVGSSLPVSWFGVDWSPLEVRGVLALTDEDEEGWSFGAVYPAASSVESGPGSVALVVTYRIEVTGEYQVVVKNADTVMARRLSLSFVSTPGSAQQHATHEP